MVPILTLCFAANSTRSGSRAISPSSFNTSQITAAGVSPASCARSHPASVCPARTSTPPFCAISGKMCPGCTMSSGLASFLTAACTVRARSAAEIPVVTPLAASIDSVKLVPIRERLSPTISRRSSCRQRSSVSVRQISPRPCLAMKLIASGVTNSAAISRSPSFSRSSSSTRTTMRPAPISAMISAMLLMPILISFIRAKPSDTTGPVAPGHIRVHCNHLSRTLRRSVLPGGTRRQTRGTEDPARARVDPDPSLIGSWGSSDRGGGRSAPAKHGYCSLHRCYLKRETSANENVVDSSHSYDRPLLCRERGRHPVEREREGRLRRLRRPCLYRERRESASENGKLAGLLQLHNGQDVGRHHEGRREGHLGRLGGEPAFCWI